MHLHIVNTILNQSDIKISIICVAMSAWHGYVVYIETSNYEEIKFLRKVQNKAGTNICDIPKEVFKD